MKLRIEENVTPTHSVALCASGRLKVHRFHTTTAAPPSARALRRRDVHVPRAVVLPRPLQHLQVPSLSSACTAIPVRIQVILAPRAPLLPRPNQYVQVPALSGVGARPCIPMTVLRACPNQHLRVPALSGVFTGPLVPRAAVLPRPLQHARFPSTAIPLVVPSSHGHPFAFAQAIISTDATKSRSTSGTAPPVPARGKPRDTTAASHGLPTRESRAQSVGSS